MKRHEAWQVYGALLVSYCLLNKEMMLISLGDWLQDHISSLCSRSSITDGPANVVPAESSPLHMLREPIAPAPSGDSKRGPSTPSPAPASEIENARVIVGISTRFGTMT
ncbi:hypothetical protein Peur_048728 [Populus x canadensis]